MIQIYTERERESEMMGASQLVPEVNNPPANTGNTSHEKALGADFLISPHIVERG